MSGFYKIKGNILFFNNRILNLFLMMKRNIIMFFLGGVINLIVKSEEYGRQGVRTSIV